MILYLFDSRNTSYFTKDLDNDIYLNWIKKQINTISRNNTTFLIGITIFLLGIYSFIAYSFLETSSMLVFNEHYEIKIKNSATNSYSEYTNDLSLISNFSKNNFNTSNN
jgi:hypothetical protein